MDTVSVGCAVLVSLEEKSSVGATVVSGVAMRCALSRAANPSGVRGTSEERFKKMMMPTASNTTAIKRMLRIIVSLRSEDGFAILCYPRELSLLEVELKQV